MNDIGLIFDRLFNFFNVSTITELAKKLEMSQPAVTNWQRRNSINAIRKKCRELGIYNEIFEDNHNDKSEENIIINSVLLEQAKNEASKFGLDINSYIEHLIIQDLKK